METKKDRCSLEIDIIPMKGDMSLGFKKEDCRARDIAQLNAILSGFGPNFWAMEVHGKYLITTTISLVDPEIRMADFIWAITAHPGKVLGSLKRIDDVLAQHH